MHCRHRDTLHAPGIPSPCSRHSASAQWQLHVLEATDCGDAVPADLAALLQGEAGRLGVLLAQQLLRARLFGRRASLGAAPVVALQACEEGRRQL